MFWLGKILTIAFLPPGSLIVLFIAAAVLSLFRKSEKARKWSIALVVVGILSFIACTMGPIADAMLAPLENAHPALAPVSSLDRKEFPSYGAIVVLGSGAVAFSPEEGKGSSLGQHSTRRVAYAYRLSKMLGLPIIFSGGEAYGADKREGEARAAKRCLTEWGMDGERIIIEEESRSTWENARYTAELLESMGKGGEKLILVTSAFHMDRAVKSFQKNGMDVLPAPTDYLSSRKAGSWTDWLPSPEASEKICLALHETAGGAWYSLRPAKKR